MVILIKKDYPGIEKDSSEYGNCLEVSNGNKILTGSNEKYALDNIYDIAGNENEWTMEAHTDEHYKNHYRVLRGGGKYNYGERSPISRRYMSLPSLNDENDKAFRRTI